MSDQHSRAAYNDTDDATLDQETQTEAYPENVDPGSPGGDRAFAFKINLLTGETIPVGHEEFVTSFAPFDGGTPEADGPSKAAPEVEELRRKIKHLMTALHDSEERQYRQSRTQLLEERMAVAERLIDVAFPRGCCTRCEAVRDVLTAQNHAVATLLNLINENAARLATATRPDFE